MKTLENYAAEGIYLKLKNEGETFTGRFLSYKVKYSEKFEKDVIEYKFEVDGEEKQFTSSSRALAKKLSEAGEGALVKITVVNEQPKAFSVENLSRNKIAKKVIPEPKRENTDEEIDIKDIPF